MHANIDGINNIAINSVAPSIRIFDKNFKKLPTISISNSD